MRFWERIDVSPAFIALLCVYFYFDPAETFAPFLLSVTAHEVGHLVALRSLGAEIYGVRFRLSGAVMQTQPMGYWQEFVAAAAGPAVSFALFFAFARQFPTFSLVNFCLFAYNLLPFYPLDGGRMLRALLHLLLPEGIASLLARIVCGLALLLLGILACYLTCVRHVGLWAVVVYAFLLLRIAGLVFPQTYCRFLRDNS